MTLTQAVLPTDSWFAKLALVLAGSFLVAVSARAEVPMFPVPMSLQTLAISLIGLTYGARLAGATLLAYLAQGAVGLPVFAGGGAGVAYMMGPTGGYLLGFVGMAWLTGLMVERGFGRGLPRLVVAALVPATLLFVPGVAWLWAVTPLDLNGAIAAGMLPFLLGGVVKSAVAAMIAAGGWQALRSQK
ncbi:biotin transporter BioY [Rhodobacteraceae bacterium SC52]|uniref:Biotin transporter n=2 Tax=Meridianimarinicoccus aquatilis TaxID=2552766 RepID=A0A4R6AMA3_9RHOB|nr:biotin transporter BioY [Rhodobacteraceae bacterium SC52]TDL84414.1 biotin transporter BioY [Fluviibacterium aquatile]